MKSAKRERKYRKRLDTILNFYKKLIQLRKKLPVIANGTIRFLDEESEGVIGYVRELEGTKLVVLCNLCEGMKIKLYGRVSGIHMNCCLEITLMEK